MPVYTRPLIDVTGCDIPNLGFDGLEKQILKLIGSTAESFQNPIEGAMGEVQGAIGSVLGEINTSVGATLLDENGEEITTFGFLASKLEGLNSGISDFRVHSDRLSGLSISDFGPNSPYGPGGIQGNYPGLAGLHSIASQYNSLKESLRDPAQAAKDHYSPIFNSLFGPGDDMMRSIDSLVKGDVANFLSNFPQGGNDSLEDLNRLGASISTLQSGIYNLINDDNLQYEFALDFVLKHTVGMSVLQMLDEPCFGTKLLEKIASPALAGIALT